jgi:cytoplasmic iron level regulating protein YaaA (DUF328/UPF0246 family)
LTIIPCGQSKIWNKQPKHGPEKARNAYTGAPFKVNKTFAEKFCSKLPDRWLILSAKYGFIDPEFEIEDYNVTFKRPIPKPISITELKKQALDKGLTEYELIIALGGEDYSSKVKQIFANHSKDIAPATGLPIGLGMNRIKKLQKMRVENKCSRHSSLMRDS